MGERISWASKSHSIPSLIGMCREIDGHSTDWLPCYYGSRRSVTPSRSSRYQTIQQRVFNRRAASFSRVVWRISYMQGEHTISGNGNGRAEYERAVATCDELFQLRFAEITVDVSYDAWTPWFHGIAWDTTMLIFDKRSRNLWLLAVTDYGLNLPDAATPQVRPRLRPPPLSATPHPGSPMATRVASQPRDRLHRRRSDDAAPQGELS